MSFFAVPPMMSVRSPRPTAIGTSDGFDEGGAVGPVGGLVTMGGGIPGGMLVVGIPGGIPGGVTGVLVVGKGGIPGGDVVEMMGGVPGGDPGGGSVMTTGGTTIGGVPGMMGGKVMGGVETMTGPVPGVGTGVVLVPLMALAHVLGPTIPSTTKPFWA
jgi:hypothetical protein